jgi:hypothetical protein
MFFVCYIVYPLEAFPVGFILVIAGILRRKERFLAYIITNIYNRQTSPFPFFHLLCPFTTESYM